MGEIYEKWVLAHGVMIISPVHWYSPPSVLKLMMDRLVCADGGNPDPTSTEGKTAKLAKQLEEKGWDYPKHLAGRAFSVIAHGDAEGALDVRRAISGWLSDMELESAGHGANLDRYIGYYGPYASSPQALDGDEALFAEVRHACRLLAEKASHLRSHPPRSEGFREPRPK
jgi:multimeric flavodoxin WrbA